MTKVRSLTDAIAALTVAAWLVAMLAGQAGGVDAISAGRQPPPESRASYCGGAIKAGLRLFAAPERSGGAAK